MKKPKRTEIKEGNINIKLKSGQAVHGLGVPL